MASELADEVVRPAEEDITELDSPEEAGREVDIESVFVLVLAAEVTGGAPYPLDPAALAIELAEDIGKEVGIESVLVLAPEVEPPGVVAEPLEEDSAEVESLEEMDEVGTGATVDSEPVIVLAERPGAD